MQRSADCLHSLDRCPRKAFFEKSWERQCLHPKDILRRSIETGLASDAVDPGVDAGDECMTLCAERGLDISSSDVYTTGMNIAALSDIIVTSLRDGVAWERPADAMLGDWPWVSSCFREPSGVRLKRLVLASRWNAERSQAERCSWYTMAESAVYGLPVTMFVVVVGQLRQGRFMSPWSKGWLHPRSKTLRIRKVSGEGFSGAWIPCWREEQDQLSRDLWMDQMLQDGVLHDCLFQVEYDPPCKEVATKIRKLAEKKLAQIEEMDHTPDPSPSVCYAPVPCPFTSVCWQFQSEPSERNGFIRIQSPA